MKRRTSTPSTTVMSISTRRLKEHLENIHWRSRTILREELPCLTNCTSYLSNNSIFLSSLSVLLWSIHVCYGFDVTNISSVCNLL